MRIITYTDRYKEQIIELILNIQNNEAKIGLSLDEQPDLKDIDRYYTSTGGAFWLAVENDRVIGTIGLIMRENSCAILKKFFVAAEYRGRGIGLKLYLRLLGFAKDNSVRHIILDTPSVAKTSHRFYESAGFYKTERVRLPIDYTYPDRESLLYILDL